MNADDQHACEVLSGDHGCRGVLISVERYQQLVDDAAGFAAARARANGLRRQLDKRNAAEREAAERLHEAVRAWRELDAESAIQALRDLNAASDVQWAVINRLLIAIDDAPATAVAAVLPATAEDAEVARLTAELDAANGRTVMRAGRLAASANHSASTPPRIDAANGGDRE